MSRVEYKITPSPARSDMPDWAVRRDGKPGMTYATQEAAFEVVVSEAMGDLRSGNDVLIEVRSSPAGAVDREAR